MRWGSQTWKDTVFVACLRDLRPEVFASWAVTVSSATVFSCSNNCLLTCEIRISFWVTVFPLGFVEAMRLLFLVLALTVTLLILGGEIRSTRRGWGSWRDGAVLLSGKSFLTSILKVLLPIVMMSPLDRMICPSNSSPLTDTTASLEGKILGPIPSMKSMEQWLDRTEASRILKSADNPLPMT